MSANAENIKTLINKYVRNDATASYHNLRMNSILLQIVDLADGMGGGVGNGASVVELRSANFSNARDCPLTSLAGRNIAVELSDIGRFLYKDEGEWADLPGGGFRILLPGFDATTTNYHVYVHTL